MLANLHLGALVDKLTPKAIRQTLENLATGSDAYQVAYETAMERIEGQHIGQAKLAKQVLSWITFSMEPLTIAALQHALAVEVGTSEFDETNISQIEDMVSVCAGLVTVDEESQIIRLVHYTTQEYFDQTWTRWFPDVQSDITKSCVTYLAYNSFQSFHPLTWETIHAWQEDYPLYRYAALYWGHHARRSSAALEMIMNFLQKADLEAPIQLIAFSGQFMHHFQVVHHMQKLHLSEAGFHLAVHFGIEAAVKVFLFGMGDSNDTDGLPCRTLLLDSCAPDVESTNWERTPPLLVATKFGYSAIVKLLLDTNIINVDCRDGDGRTPLSHAACYGNVTIVQLLLDSGKADIDSRDMRQQTPLSWAAHMGNNAVVEMLWNTGMADIDSKNNAGNTPLLLAAIRGHDTTIKLLFGLGEVNINAQCMFGRTPFEWAVEFGSSNAVKALLEIGADINMGHADGETSLSRALRRGRVRTALLTILFEHLDFDITHTDCRGRTYIYWAIRCGIRRKDVECGLSESAKDRIRRLLPSNWALNAACASGAESAALDAIRDIRDNELTEQDDDGWTPLYTATRYQMRETEVQLAGLLGGRLLMPNLKKPGRWHARDKSPNLQVSDCGSFVSCTARQNVAQDSSMQRGRGLIRADHAMPGNELFYYEIEIVKGATADVIGMGFCDDYAPLNIMIGWTPGSWAYHGDDGRMFNADTMGQHYGPLYAEGDVVGCGVDFDNGLVFFTKNGDYLG